MIPYFIEILNSFLGWLIQTSFQASVLTGLVLMAHVIFRRQLTAQWRYLLWFVVVLCLAMPIYPSSRLSVFNLLNRPVQPVAAESAPASIWRVVYGGPGPAKSAGPVVPAAHQEVVSSGTLAANGRMVSGGSAGGILTKFRSLDGWAVFGIAWLIGVVALLARFIIPVIRLRMRIVSLPPITDPSVLTLLQQCKEELGLVTPLWVVESPEIRSPVLMGFIRPRLLLPPDLLRQFSLREIRFIFLHELSHVRHNDIVTNWLMTVLQTFHWFNPVIWLAFSRMRAEREAACDERALACTREGENGEYGDTILKLLENAAGIQAPLPVLAGILETKHQLKRRFSMIANYRKTRLSWILPSGLLVVLACMGLTAAQNKVVTDVGGKAKVEAAKAVKTDPSPTPPAAKSEIAVETRFLSMPVETAEELLRQNREETKGTFFMSEKVLQRMRELEKQGQIKVVTSPKLTASNSEVGRILATKEYVYPSAYVDGTLAPTAFSTRELGTILDIRPSVSSNGAFISATLSPEIVELGGASKIEARNSKGEPVTLEQPLFSKRSISTSVILPNGGTLLLAGMDPPLSEKKSPKDGDRTMLILLTAKSDPAPKSPSVDGDGRLPLVTVEAEWLRMSRSVANELLKQETGSRDAIEIKEDRLQLVREMRKEGKVKLLSVQRLTTTSGESAKVLASREVIYASDWTTGKDNKSVAPAAFSTREVGIILDLKPQASPDRKSVEVTLSPELVQLSPSDEGTDYRQALHQNPTFSKRSLATSIKLRSGKTVLLTGMEAPEGESKDGQDAVMYLFLTAHVY